MLAPRIITDAGLFLLLADWVDVSTFITTSARP